MGRVSHPAPQTSAIRDVASTRTALTIFKVAAVIGSHPYSSAWGRNKKEAEQKAAMNALAQISGDPVPFEAD